MSESANPEGGALSLPPHRHPHPALHSHFERIEQQRDAGSLGMWIFLATEILFFGGLFASYIEFRALHYTGFDVGSHLLERDFGALMTFVLLTSSFTMAMSVHSARLGHRKLPILFLVLTVILGVAFLGIKFTEYSHMWQVHLVPGFNFYPTPTQLKNAPAGSVEMFVCFYFFMTGLHAVHMIVGIGVLTVLTILAGQGKISSERYHHVEVSGLYWHFVDIIWIYLFPLLYLIGGR